MRLQDLSADTFVNWSPWVNVTCDPNSAMLLDMRGYGKWHVLNETAAKIMMLMKTPRSLRDVGNELAEEYGIHPSAALEDSMLFAKKMIDRGLLASSSSTSRKRLRGEDS